MRRFLAQVGVLVLVIGVAYGFLLISSGWFDDRGPHYCLNDVYRHGCPTPSESPFFVDTNFPDP